MPSGIRIYEFNRAKTQFPHWLFEFSEWAKIERKQIVQIEWFLDVISSYFGEKVKKNQGMIQILVPMRTCLKHNKILIL